MQYSLENRQNFNGVPPLTTERVRDALTAAVAKAATNEASTKKIKGKPGADLRKSLAVSITELPPVVVDHALQLSNFDTATKPAEVLQSETLLNDLVKALSEARKIVDQITTSAVCKGYIFAKRRQQVSSEETTGEEGAAPKRDNLLYEDFHPFLPLKLQNDPSIEVLEFEGYNKTVDEFFSSLEGQKLESRLSEREAAAKRKLDAAKQDQAKRIEGLQEAQTLNLRKAAAIEANVERVQEAMNAVNGLLAQGMDWVDIGKLVEREKKRHNPVAETIKLPLNLAENMITLFLAEEDEVDEEQDDPYETDESEAEDEATATGEKKDQEPGKGLTVDINLTLSPWGNAREYYEQKRTAAVKTEKTQMQAVKALKSAEQKINEDLKKGLKQEKALLQPTRKQLWFEKFLWFISSDGYLVLGGKDAPQNEILYKRYLRKGDVYCHADLHGASTVIIKNNPKTPDAPIPPSTLSQAGSLSVCSSSAWDSKAGMGAWWVNADQVSKSAPTGEFLPTGSFMVRGKKNFLPPAPLIIGLGFMFRISDESKVKHVKHRLYDDDNRASQGASANVEQTTTSVDDEADDIPDEEPESKEANESESEDDQHEQSPRANPLQSSTGNDEDDDTDEVEEDVAEKLEEKLTIDDDGHKEDEAEDPAKNNEEQEDEEVDDGTTEAATEVSEATSRPSAAGGSSNAPSTKSNAKPTKRGQKGKAKKIANKYKDQDEEDRAAAEAFIGASRGQQRAEAEAKAKAEREAELAAAKERRRAQHQRQQKQVAEHEEVRRVMMDEGIDVLEGDEAEQVTPLDAFVGTPLPGDEILEVIPVCAPWNALVKFKYKVKLQPGATKKGKAVKEILERTKTAATKKGVVDESARDSERMWPREVELLKALKPEEVVNCVPVGKVRVMMAGGTASAGGGGGGDSKGRSKGQSKGGRGGRGSKRS